MLVARSCARVGGEDVVREGKGVEVVGVLVAGRGAKGERGQKDRG